MSDEGVCERWVHDPYFRHFTGEAFFQHAFPHERSDLSRWRKRFGERLELLLAENLKVAHDTGALRTRDLKRVTVDTMVQPKAITFPTDAKLLHAAIEGLNRLVRKHGVRLRQSYRRIAKKAAMMAGPRQTVQAPPPPIAPVEEPSRSDHPRHPPQDRGPPSSSKRHSKRRSRARRRSGHGSSASAAGSSIPRARGRMHRQRPGLGALRVRRQSLYRHQRWPRPGRSVRAPCQSAAGQSV